MTSTEYLTESAIPVANDRIFISIQHKQRGTNMVINIGEEENFKKS
jgi:hypothetical protein